MADLRSRLVPLVAALVLVACESEENSSQTYPPATCQQSCEKSVALACPGDSYSDVPTCVTQCEAQIAGCADQSMIDNYLGCAVATPMTCSDTLGSSTSAQCVAEGLAYFACLQGIDLTDVGGSDIGGSDTGGSTNPVAPPAVPAASSGQVAATLATADGTEGPYTCTIGDGTGNVVVSVVPEAAGGGFAITVSCGITSDTEMHVVSLGVMRPSLAPGAYAVTSSTPEAVSNDQAAVTSIVNDQGYAMTANGNGGVVWEGELVIEAFDGTARTASGYATVQWPRVAEVIDGVARNVVDRPGAASIRFSSP